MSFGGQPSAFVPPTAPQVAQQMQPTTMKPGKKPSQPTVIAEALTPNIGAGTDRQRTLIGGAST